MRKHGTLRQVKYFPTRGSNMNLLFNVLCSEICKQKIVLIAWRNKTLSYRNFYSPLCNESVWNFCIFVVYFGSEWFFFRLLFVCIFLDKSTTIYKKYSTERCDSRSLAANWEWTYFRPMEFGIFTTFLMKWISSAICHKDVCNNWSRFAMKMWPLSFEDLRSVGIEYANNVFIRGTTYP